MDLSIHYHIDWNFELKFILIDFEFVIYIEFRRSIFRVDFRNYLNFHSTILKGFRKWDFRESLTHVLFLAYLFMNSRIFWRAGPRRWNMYFLVTYWGSLTDFRFSYDFNPPYLGRHIYC